MHDFDRMAKKILRKLGRGKRLQRCGNAYVLSGWQGGAKTVVSTAVVAAMLARDWLVRDKDDFVRSDQGRSWLAGGETSFADRHRVLDARLVKDDCGNDCYVVVNAAESPLALLRRRGRLTAVQFDAGEKLRRDFTYAQLTPRMGVDYSMPLRHSALRPPLAETVVAARQRFNQALRAVGPGLSDVLFDVCCFLKGLDDTERSHGWSRSSGKVVLCIALDRLAEHYGMIKPRCESGTRSWRAPDPPSSRGAEEGGGRV